MEIKISDKQQNPNNLRNRIAFSSFLMIGLIFAVELVARMNGFNQGSGSYIVDSLARSIKKRTRNRDIRIE
jgi:hypothetical protein